MDKSVSHLIPQPQDPFRADTSAMWSVILCMRHVYIYTDHFSHHSIILHTCVHSTLLITVYH